MATNCQDVTSRPRLTPAGWEPDRRPRSSPGPGQRLPARTAGLSSRFSWKGSVATGPPLPAHPAPAAELRSRCGCSGRSRAQALPRPGGRRGHDAKWAAGRLGCHVPGRGWGGARVNRASDSRRLAGPRPLLTLAAQVPGRWPFQGAGLSSQMAGQPLAGQDSPGDTAGHSGQARRHPRTRAHGLLCQAVALPLPEARLLLPTPRLRQHGRRARLRPPATTTVDVFPDHPPQG